MSPQERQVLQDFLDQLVQARDVPKDPEADDLIARAVARQPDAGYLLTQRALLVEQALNAAKRQIADLQNQVAAGRGAGAPAAGGFLEGANAWGHSPGNASRYAAPGRAAPVYDAPPVQQQAPMQQAPMQAAPARSGFLGGGGSGFLGNIAATAAGVAGGAFLFQGIESLMGGHHGGGFLGGNNPNVAPIEETTVNNYYGDNANAPDSTAWNDANDSTDFADNGSYSDDASGGDDSLV